MSHRQTSVRERCVQRLRGLAVVLVCAGLALPLLHASGGSRGATVDEVVAAARAQVGDTYLWGGNGPDAWDCSGFTSFVWGTVGQVAGMPRVSGAQQRWAVPLPREQLLPGDLVFFGDPVTHVALYVGEGRVVDASSARRGVVERPLWTATVTRYGRVPRPDMPEVAPWTPPSPAPAPTGTAVASDTGPAGPPAAPTAPTGRQPAAQPPAQATAQPTAQTTAQPVVRPSRRPATRATTRPTAAPTGARPASAARPAAPAARPTASTRPTRAVQSARPAAAPRATGRPARPAARPTATARSATTAPAAARPPAPAARVLTGLPAAQATPSSRRALAAVAGVRSVTGTRTWTDVSVVREAWRHAGGGSLPTARDALVARGVQVARPDVRVGDLVVYGVPARQLYVYAGKGYMVGHSPEHGAVVVRRVHTGDVRFVRLRG